MNTDVRLLRKNALVTGTKALLLFSDLVKPSKSQVLGADQRVAVAYHFSSFVILTNHHRANARGVCVEQQIKNANHVLPQWDNLLSTYLQTIYCGC